MTAPRVAVVGAGIAGLAAAWRLRNRVDLTVFEAGAEVGGHTRTVDIEEELPGGDRRRLALDTGFLVFNRRNYPRFSALLDELGVASKPTTMSFSVRCDRSGLEYNGTGWNELFAQRSNLLRPRFWGMLRDILRFSSMAPEAVAGPDRNATVGEFTARHGFGEAFVEDYLVPIGASLWSCPAGVFREFPIRFVVDFLHHHGMLQVKGRPQWRVVEGGSRTYVRAMLEELSPAVRASSPIRRLRRLHDGERRTGVEVLPVGGTPERFDEVIVAAHADTALAMVEDPTPVEREVLAAFPYGSNTALLHTDPAVLPKRSRAQAAWNYRRHPDAEGQLSVTYDLNQLQGLRSRERYLVTLNDPGTVDPARVLRRLEFEHPLFLAAHDAAASRREELIRHHGISYCGAYWGYGFHEDGARSGEEVAAAFADSDRDEEAA